MYVSVLILYQMVFKSSIKALKFIHVLYCVLDLAAVIIEYLAFFIFVGDTLPCLPQLTSQQLLDGVVYQAQVSGLLCLYVYMCWENEVHVHVAYFESLFSKVSRIWCLSQFSHGAYNCYTFLFLLVKIIFFS